MHRLDKATREREAKPKACRIVGVAEALKRHKHVAAARNGHAGATVDHTNLDSIKHKARRNLHW